MGSRTKIPKQTTVLSRETKIWTKSILCMLTSWWRLYMETPSILLSLYGCCVSMNDFNPTRNRRTQVSSDWLKINFRILKSRLGLKNIFIAFGSWFTKFKSGRNAPPTTFAMTLHWRHNDYDGVSNHQPHGCLLHRLFRRRSKKTSKLRVTSLCVGNSTGPVNSPLKGPVTLKTFPFDDVIMNPSNSTKTRRIGCLSISLAAKCIFELHWTGFSKCRLCSSGRVGESVKKCNYL